MKHNLGLKFHNCNEKNVTFHLKSKAQFLWSKVGDDGDDLVTNLLTKLELILTAKTIQVIILNIKLVFDRICNQNQVDCYCKCHRQYNQ